MEWQLQTAKSQYSELIRQAVLDGPQFVTVRGHSEAVVLSTEAYERLVRGQSSQDSLVDFLRRSPLTETELDLEHDKGMGRDINLQCVTCWIRAYCSNWYNATIGNCPVSKIVYAVIINVRIKIQTLIIAYIMVQSSKVSRSYPSLKS